MDFPRSSWAASSSVSAALAAPLSCRLARKALLLQRKVGDDDVAQRRNLGLTSMPRRRRFLLAPPRAASSSSNSDEPAIAGGAKDGHHLEMSPRRDEKSREERRDEEQSARSSTQQQSFTAVAAAALVVLSSLSSPFFFLFPPPAQASAGGDALMTFNKRADAAADAVAGVLLGALPKIKSGSLSSSSSSSSSSPAAAEREAAAAASAAAAAALLKEVRDVVALNYLDTRSDGGRGVSASSSSSSSGGSSGRFDLAAWDAAVEAELTGGGGGGRRGLFGAGTKKGGNVLKDVPAARRAARRLLAFSLPDPYSRFLSPEEFAAMSRYDITGVGLNLGSADEYERKVGERPPGAAAAPSSSGPSSSSSFSSSASSSSRPSSSPPSSPPSRNDSNPSIGVWVIGVIRGSPADAAGVQQGDRVVSVDGRVIDPSKESAFDVASRIQGAGVAEAAAEESGRGGGGAAAAAAKTSAAATGKKSAKSLFSSFPLLSSSSSSSSGGNPTRKLSLDVLRRSDGSRSRVVMEAPVAPAAVSPVSFKLLVEEGNGGGGGGGGGGRGGGEGGASKIGVIKLDSFNARARSDAAAAVSELLSKGADSFVLDLRGNRGGLVSEGAEVAALFLDKGSTVATTLGRAPLLDDDAIGGGAAASLPSSLAAAAAATPSPHRATKTTTRTLSTTAQPLVPPGAARLTVLVDERTASAGEIVAGALRDNCRAPLVAVYPAGAAGAAPSGPFLRTYGKGLIQSVYELGDGSGLVLTVGKYFTPSGTDLDREGLAADLQVVGGGSSPGPGGSSRAAGVPPRAEAEAVLDACLRGRGGGEGL